MRMIAFSVFDRAARGYSAPFFQQTRGLGERMFAQACVDPESMIAKHPGDFELFEVGSFDSETGRFEFPPEPVLLTTAVQTLSLRAVQNG